MFYSNNFGFHCSTVTQFSDLSPFSSYKPLKGTCQHLCPVQKAGIKFALVIYLKRFYFAARISVRVSVQLEFTGWEAPPAGVWGGDLGRPWQSRDNAEGRGREQ